ncbi:MAG TPA: hypothetical protein VKI19_12550 [Acidimicrobiales bacterium]|nr:hypothetical protein [Acidimicrobiales bacterium]
MSRGQAHRVTIERRGRSHRAACSCGWSSHAWNELRPAEADAWHHVFGDEPIVDVTAVADERGPAVLVGPKPGVDHGPPVRPPAVEALVRRAQDMAARPSPYTKDAPRDLWQIAGEDTVAVQSAISEIEELLARHDRQSSGAADSEWLLLITAKRLLVEAQGHARDMARPWRAVI